MPVSLENRSNTRAAIPVEAVKSFMIRRQSNTRASRSGAVVLPVDQVVASQAAVVLVVADCWAAVVEEDCWAADWVSGDWVCLLLQSQFRLLCQAVAMQTLMTHQVVLCQAGAMQTLTTLRVVEHLVLLIKPYR